MAWNIGARETYSHFLDILSGVGLKMKSKKLWNLVDGQETTPMITLPAPANRSPAEKDRLK